MQPSAGEAASAAIRTLVTRGSYRPGDRLPPERELADALGCSRPTVREAIHRLIAAGLLEARHGSGNYVAELDLDALFGVRLRLEPYAAGLAAAARQPESLARLAGLIEALPQQIDDADSFAVTDSEIHRTIAEASGNPILGDLLGRLADLAAVSRAVTSTERATRQATLRDLRALVRAVRRGDADAAAAAMEAHLLALREVASSAPEPGRQIARVA